MLIIGYEHELLITNSSSNLFSPNMFNVYWDTRQARLNSDAGTRTPGFRAPSTISENKSLAMSDGTDIWMYKYYASPPGNDISLTMVHQAVIASDQIRPPRSEGKAITIRYIDADSNTIVPEELLSLPSEIVSLDFCDDSTLLVSAGYYNPLNPSNVISGDSGGFVTLLKRQNFTQACGVNSLENLVTMPNGHSGLMCSPDYTFPIGSGTLRSAFVGENIYSYYLDVQQAPLRQFSSEDYNSHLSEVSQYWAPVHHWVSSTPHFGKSIHCSLGPNEYEAKTADFGPLDPDPGNLYEELNRRTVASSLNEDKTLMLFALGVPHSNKVLVYTEMTSLLYNLTDPNHTNVHPVTQSPLKLYSEVEKTANAAASGPARVLLPLEPQVLLVSVIVPTAESGTPVPGPMSEGGWEFGHHVKVTDSLLIVTAPGTGAFPVIIPAAPRRTYEMQPMVSLANSGSVFVFDLQSSLSLKNFFGTKVYTLPNYGGNMDEFVSSQIARRARAANQKYNSPLPGMTYAFFCRLSGIAQAQQMGVGIAISKPDTSNNVLVAVGGVKKEFLQMFSINTSSRWCSNVYSLIMGGNQSPHGEHNSIGFSTNGIYYGAPFTLEIDEDLESLPGRIYFTHWNDAHYYSRAVIDNYFYSSEKCPAGYSAVPGKLVALSSALCTVCPTYNAQYLNGPNKPTNSTWLGPGLGCTWTCNPGAFGPNCRPCDQLPDAPGLPPNTRWITRPQDYLYTLPNENKERRVMQCMWTCMHGHTLNTTVYTPAYPGILATTDAPPSGEDPNPCGPPPPPSQPLVPRTIGQEHDRYFDVDSAHGFVSTDFTLYLMVWLPKEEIPDTIYTQLKVHAKGVSTQLSHSLPLEETELVFDMSDSSSVFPLPPAMKERMYAAFASAQNIVLGTAPSVYEQANVYTYIVRVSPLFASTTYILGVSVSNGQWSPSSSYTLAPQTSAPKLPTALPVPTILEYNMHSSSILLRVQTRTTEINGGDVPASWLVCLMPLMNNQMFDIDPNIEKAVDSCTHLVIYGQLALKMRNAVLDGLRGGCAVPEAVWPSTIVHPAGVATRVLDDFTLTNLLRHFTGHRALNTSKIDIGYGFGKAIHVNNIEEVVRASVSRIRVTDSQCGLKSIHLATLAPDNRFIGFSDDNVLTISDSGITFGIVGIPAAPPDQHFRFSVAQAHNSTSGRFSPLSALSMRIPLSQHAPHDVHIPPAPLPYIIYANSGVDEECNILESPMYTHGIECSEHGPSSLTLKWNLPDGLPTDNLSQVVMLVVYKDNGEPYDTPIYNRLYYAPPIFRVDNNNVSYRPPMSFRANKLLANTTYGVHVSFKYNPVANDVHYSQPLYHYHQSCKTGPVSVPSPPVLMRDGQWANDVAVKATRTDIEITWGPLDNTGGEESWQYHINATLIALSPYPEFLPSAIVKGELDGRTEHVLHTLEVVKLRRRVYFTGLLPSSLICIAISVSNTQGYSGLSSTLPSFDDLESYAQGGIASFPAAAEMLRAQNIACVATLGQMQVDNFPAPKLLTGETSFLSHFPSGGPEYVQFLPSSLTQQKNPWVGKNILQVLHSLNRTDFCPIELNSLNVPLLQLPPYSQVTYRGSPFQASYVFLQLSIPKVIGHQLTKYFRIEQSEDKRVWRDSRGVVLTNTPIPSYDTNCIFWHQSGYTVNAIYNRTHSISQPRSTEDAILVFLVTDLQSQKGYFFRAIYADSPDGEAHSTEITDQILLPADHLAIGEPALFLGAPQLLNVYSAIYEDETAARVQWSAPLDIAGFKKTDIRYEVYIRTLFPGSGCADIDDFDIPQLEAASSFPKFYNLFHTTARGELEVALLELREGSVIQVVVLPVAYSSSMPTLQRVEGAPSEPLTVYIPAAAAPLPIMDLTVPLLSARPGKSPIVVRNVKHGGASALQELHFFTRTLVSNPVDGSYTPTEWTLANRVSIAVDACTSTSSALLPPLPNPLRLDVDKNISGDVVELTVSGVNAVGVGPKLADLNRPLRHAPSRLLTYILPPELPLMESAIELANVHELTSKSTSNLPSMVSRTAHSRLLAGDPPVHPPLLLPTSGSPLPSVSAPEIHATLSSQPHSSVTLSVAYPSDFLTPGESHWIALVVASSVNSFHQQPVQTFDNYSQLRRRQGSPGYDCTLTSLCNENAKILTTPTITVSPALPSDLYDHLDTLVHFPDIFPAPTDVDTDYIVRNGGSNVVEDAYGNPLDVLSVIPLPPNWNCDCTSSNNSAFDPLGELECPEVLPVTVTGLLPGQTYAFSVVYGADDKVSVPSPLSDLYVVPDLPIPAPLVSPPVVSALPPFVHTEGSDLYTFLSTETIALRPSHSALVSIPIPEFPLSEFLLETPHVPHEESSEACSPLPTPFEGQYDLGKCSPSLTLSHLTLSIQEDAPDAPITTLSVGLKDCISVGNRIQSLKRTIGGAERDKWTASAAGSILDTTLPNRPATFSSYLYTTHIQRPSTCFVTIRGLKSSTTYKLRVEDIANYDLSEAQTVSVTSNLVSVTPSAIMSFQTQASTPPTSATAVAFVPGTVTSSSVDVLVTLPDDFGGEYPSALAFEASTDEVTWVAHGYLPLSLVDELSIPNLQCAFRGYRSALRPTDHAWGGAAYTAPSSPDVDASIPDQGSLDRLTNNGRSVSAGLHPWQRIQMSYYSPHHASMVDIETWQLQGPGDVVSSEALLRHWYQGAVPLGLFHESDISPGDPLSARPSAATIESLQQLRDPDTFFTPYLGERDDRLVLLVRLTQLHPDTPYRFRVITFNQAGRWNETTPTMPLDPPATFAPSTISEESCTTDVFTLGRFFHTMQRLLDTDSVVHPPAYVSDATPSVAFVDDATIPQHVHNVTITRMTATQTTLSWLPPPDTGGNPVSCYTIEIAVDAFGSGRDTCDMTSFASQYPHQGFVTSILPARYAYTHGNSLYGEIWSVPDIGDWQDVNWPPVVPPVIESEPGDIAVDATPVDLTFGELYVLSNGTAPDTLVLRDHDPYRNMLLPFATYFNSTDRFLQRVSPSSPPLSTGNISPHNWMVLEECLDAKYLSPPPLAWDDAQQPPPFTPSWFVHADQIAAAQSSPALGLPVPIVYQFSTPSSSLLRVRVTPVTQPVELKVPEPSGRRMFEPFQGLQRELGLSFGFVPVREEELQPPSLGPSAPQSLRPFMWQPFPAASSIPSATPSPSSIASPSTTSTPLEDHEPEFEIVVLPGDLGASSSSAPTVSSVPIVLPQTAALSPLSKVTLAGGGSSPSPSKTASGSASPTLLSTPTRTPIHKPTPSATSGYSVVQVKPTYKPTMSPSPPFFVEEWHFEPNGSMGHMYFDSTETEGTISLSFSKSSKVKAQKDLASNSRSIGGHRTLPTSAAPYYSWLNDPREPDTALFPAPALLFFTPVLPPPTPRAGSLVVRNQTVIQFTSLIPSPSKPLRDIVQPLFAAAGLTVPTSTANTICTPDRVLVWLSEEVAATSPTNPAYFKPWVLVHDINYHTLYPLRLRYEKALNGTAHTLPFITNAGNISLAVGGLTRGTRYKLALQLGNAGGWGSPSTPFILSTQLALPVAPAKPEIVSTTPVAFTLRVFAPSDMGGGTVTRMTPDYFYLGPASADPGILQSYATANHTNYPLADSALSPWKSGPYFLPATQFDKEFQHTLTGFFPDSVYAVRYRAQNSFGQGPGSLPLVVYTDPPRQCSGPPALSDPGNRCSGNGNCHPWDGTCLCNKGYGKPACQFLDGRLVRVKVLVQAQAGVTPSFNETIFVYSFAKAAASYTGYSLPASRFTVMNTTVELAPSPSLRALRRLVGDDKVLYHWSLDILIHLNAEERGLRMDFLSNEYELGNYPTEPPALSYATPNITGLNTLHMLDMLTTGMESSSILFTGLQAFSFSAQQGETEEPINAIEHIELASEIPDCSMHLECSTCTLEAGCGWCASSSTCLPGTALQPNLWYLPPVQAALHSQCTANVYGEKSSNWSGVGVSATITCQPMCDTFSTCTDCSQRAHCGWCTASKTCMPRTALVLPGMCSAYANTENQCPAKVCRTYTNIDSCTNDQNCGWCQSNATCGEADSFGFTVASGLPSCFSNSTHKFFYRSTTKSCPFTYDDIPTCDVCMSRPGCGYCATSRQCGYLGTTIHAPAAGICPPDTSNPLMPSWIDPRDVDEFGQPPACPTYDLSQKYKCMAAVTERGFGSTANTNACIQCLQQSANHGCAYCSKTSSQSIQHQCMSLGAALGVQKAIDSVGPFHQSVPATAAGIHTSFTSECGGNSYIRGVANVTYPFNFTTSLADMGTYGPSLSSGPLTRTVNYLGQYPLTSTYYLDASDTTLVRGMTQLSLPPTIAQGCPVQCTTTPQQLTSPKGVLQFGSSGLDSNLFPLYYGSSGVGVCYWILQPIDFVNITTPSGYMNYIPTPFPTVSVVITNWDLAPGDTLQFYDGPSTRNIPLLSAPLTGTSKPGDRIELRTTTTASYVQVVLNIKTGGSTGFRAEWEGRNFDNTESSLQLYLIIVIIGILSTIVCACIVYAAAKRIAQYMDSRRPIVLPPEEPLEETRRRAQFNGRGAPRYIIDFFPVFVMPDDKASLRDAPIGSTGVMTLEEAEQKTEKQKVDGQAKPNASRSNSNSNTLSRSGSATSNAFHNSPSLTGTNGNSNGTRSVQSLSSIVHNPLVQSSSTQSNSQTQQQPRSPVQHRPSLTSPMMMPLPASVPNPLALTPLALTQATEDTAADSSFREPIPSLILPSQVPEQGATEEPMQESLPAQIPTDASVITVYNVLRTGYRFSRNAASANPMAAAASNATDGANADHNPSNSATASSTGNVSSNSTLATPGAGSDRPAESNGVCPNPMHALAPTASAQANVPGTDSSAPNDDHACSICLAEFTSGEHIRILLCRHAFHTDCIDTALALSRICPLCRRDVLEMYAERLRILEAQMPDPLAFGPRITPLPTIDAHGGLLTSLLNNTPLEDNEFLINDDQFDVDGFEEDLLDFSESEEDDYPVPPSARGFHVSDSYDSHGSSSLDPNSSPQAPRSAVQSTSPPASRLSLQKNGTPDGDPSTPAEGQSSTGSSSSSNGSQMQSRLSTTLSNSNTNAPGSRASTQFGLDTSGYSSPPSATSLRNSLTGALSSPVHTQRNPLHPLNSPENTAASNIVVSREGSPSASGRDTAIRSSPNAAASGGGASPSDEASPTPDESAPSTARIDQRTGNVRRTTRRIRRARHFVLISNTLFPHLTPSTAYVHSILIRNALRDAIVRFSIANGQNEPENLTELSDPDLLAFAAALGIDGTHLDVHPSYFGPPKEYTRISSSLEPFLPNDTYFPASFDDVDNVDEPIVQNTFENPLYQRDTEHGESSASMQRSTRNRFLRSFSFLRRGRRNRRDEFPTSVPPRIALNREAGRSRRSISAQTVFSHSADNLMDASDSPYVNLDVTEAGVSGSQSAPSSPMERIGSDAVWNVNAENSELFPESPNPRADTRSVQSTVNALFRTLRQKRRGPLSIVPSEQISGPNEMYENPSNVASETENSMLSRSTIP